MSNPQSPIQGGSIVIQGSVVDATGRPTPIFIKWLNDLQSRVQTALNTQGQVVGVVAPVAQVNLGALLQGGASTGQVLEWNGTAWTPTNLPVIPAQTTVDGIAPTVTLVAGSNVTISDNVPSPGHITFAVAAGAGGVTSVDSITGAVTLVAGSGITVTDNSPSAGHITLAATASGPLRGTVTINAGGAASGTFSNTGTITGATTGMAVAASCSGLIGLSASHQVQWNADVSSANTVEVQVTLPNTGVNWNSLTFQVAVFA